ncbi:hypothetical protein PYCC9005_004240 [Savitreella phatthalungensis]
MQALLYLQERTQSLVLKAGKMQLDILDSALLDCTQFALHYKELHMHFESASAQLEDALATIKTFQGRLTCTVYRVHPQAMFALMDWLLGLLGSEISDAPWQFVLDKAQKAKIDPEAWLQAKGTAGVRTALAELLQLSSVQSTRKTLAKKRQKHSIFLCP